jgi:hypothetical protein
LKYNSEDYFSVIDKRSGRKICDCADEIDALMIVSFDPQTRTITRNQFLMGQDVDIQMPKALPTNEIVPIEKDKPKEPKRLKQHQNKLQESELQPIKV